MFKLSFFMLQTPYLHICSTFLYVDKFCVIWSFSTLKINHSLTHSLRGFNNFLVRACNASCDIIYYIKFKEALSTKNNMQNQNTTCNYHSTDTVSEVKLGEQVFMRTLAWMHVACLTATSPPAATLCLTFCKTASDYLYVLKVITRGMTHRL